MEWMKYSRGIVPGRTDGVPEMSRSKSRRYGVQQRSRSKNGMNGRDRVH